MTFEKKNILGQVVKADQFDSKTNLVQVIGDFYRYQTTDKPDAHHDYQVTHVDGNLLTLERK